MWDKKRKVKNDLAVIEGILIHHSAGNKCNGQRPEQVFDAFNRTGFERGYKPYGYDFFTGYSKNYGQNYHVHDGKISYCEYHWAIYEYAPNDYQLISLIDDPLWTDSGSAWRKEINEIAIAFVFCGNYEIEDIPEGMIEYFIKLFRKAAPCSWIIEKNPHIWIKGHRDTGDKTACPGKYLYTYIPRMQREITELGRVT